MTEPHLSLDALADLLAAEGSDDDVAHVSACAGCASRLDELATAELEVAAVLASLPPPPVPDGLAARLQAALDAEPALAAPADEPAPVAATATTRPAGPTVTPFPDAGRRARRPWAPAAAAAAVLVLAGGTVAGLGVLTGGTGSDDAAETSLAGDAAGGGSGADFGDLPRSQTGTDYAAGGTLAAALPGLLGGSAEPLTAPLSAEQQESSADAPEPAPAAAAPSEEELQTAQRSAEAGGTFDAATSSELDRLRTPEGLASCLTALLPPEDDTVRPLAVDYAAYAGQPALVVLLPAAGAPDKVDVFVVGAGCTVGDDRTLFFTRLDRP